MPQRSPKNIGFPCLAFLLGAWLLCPALGPAAESDDSLTTQQSRLAQRYDQLELLAGRLAELSRATQPRRARLLRELVVKSRERNVAGHFDVILEALQEESLGTATQAQGALQRDLQTLLELLLQEDRDRQLETDQKRIRKYLAELQRLIQWQRGLQARTEAGDDALEQDQGQLAESTEALRQQIETTEGLPTSPEKNTPRPEESPADASADSSSKESAAGPPEGAEDPKSPAEGTSAPPPSGEPSESSPPGAPQPGAPQPGESQPGAPQPGSPSSGAPEPDSAEPSTPAGRAEQRLQQAQENMRAALEELEAAQRDQALDRQEQALRALEEAKAELEKILRQLREEELERMLVLLEARFRKMLDAQVEIYQQTQKLEASRSSVPEHEVEIASGRLSRQEGLIVREADRALTLLRDDGTTVAFPEALEQARGDMLEIEKRLREVKLARFTQGLEEDVIAALEETLSALQQALKEARSQASQPASSSEPQEQALVDQLAELRMIRALQGRINRRTERYGEILGDAPASEQEVLAALAELALRQERVLRATRALDLKGSE